VHNDCACSISCNSKEYTLLCFRPATPAESPGPLSVVPQPAVLIAPTKQNKPPAPAPHKHLQPLASNITAYSPPAPIKGQLWDYAHEITATDQLHFARTAVTRVGCHTVIRRNCALQLSTRCSVDFRVLNQDLRPVAFSPQYLLYSRT